MGVLGHYSAPDEEVVGAMKADKPLMVFDCRSQKHVRPDQPSHAAARAESYFYVLLGRAMGCLTPDLVEAYGLPPQIRLLGGHEPRLTADRWRRSVREKLTGFSYAAPKTGF